MGTQKASKKLNSEDLDYKGLDGHKDYIGNWSRKRLCYILAKNLSVTYHVLRLLKTVGTFEIVMNILTTRRRNEPVGNRDKIL